MDKLTSIMAVVEQSVSGAAVLDKAVMLARSFGARVDLLIADSLLTPEFASRCAALGYDEVTLCSLFRSGEPLHLLLLRRVIERRPDLLVKAPTGVHPTRSGKLHGSDRDLARECPVPVLLVGTNPWDRPIRLAATVDVSDPETATVARGILQAAGFLAHGLRGTLDILYSEREQKDETIRIERAVKLAQLVREFHVGCERLQMFGGAPEQRLPPLIAARQYDLLMLGDASHRDGLQFPPNTVTDKLGNSTEGDLVLVSAGAGALERVARAASAREKTPNQPEQFV